MRKSKYHLGFIADAASGWVAEDDGRRGILRLLNDPRRTYAIIPYGEGVQTNAWRIRFCIEMQDRLLRDRRSVCLLVNTRAAALSDAAFTCRLEGRTFTQELIREVSPGRLREVVLGAEGQL